MKTETVKEIARLQGLAAELYQVALKDRELLAHLAEGNRARYYTAKLINRNADRAAHCAQAARRLMGLED